MKRIKKSLQKLRNLPILVKILVVILGVIFVVILAQIFYPKNLTPPNFRIFGHSAGFRTRIDVSQQIQNKFLESKIKIAGKGRGVEYSLSELGFSIKDVDKEVSRSMDFSFSERLIPFGWIFDARSIDVLNLTKDGGILDEKSHEIVQKLSFEAKEAEIKIENDEIVIHQAQDGFSVSHDEVQKSLESIKYNSKNIKISLSGETISPSKGQISAELEQEIKFYYTKNIIVYQQSQRYQIPKDDILSFIDIDYQSQKANINHDKIKSSLDKLPKEWFIEPGITTVKIEDGQEVGRQEAAAGTAVDKDRMSQRIADVLSASGQNQYLELITVQIPPKINYSESFTNSQAGLQAYLNKVARENNIRITVQQLGRNGWSASARGGESTVSASTYKIFIALRLFEDMKSGNLGWGSSFMGTSVDDCFNQMIIASTNACAEGWIRSYGTGNLNNFLSAKGFGGMRFSDGSAAVTTTDTLVNYYVQLWNGNLMSAAHKDRLMRSLRSHYFTKGIPAGSRGTVYNKVGFLWDYTHDSGIVVHPQGNYAIAIMTKGYSYAKIAQITREIEGIMYP